jgi:hypothetical protein
MPMNPESNENKDLSRLLATWQPDGSLPPRFAESVWRRIEAPQQSVTVWHIVRNWLEQALARPAIGFAYCAVLIAAGAGLGTWRAHEQTAELQEQLQARYVQAISPYHKSPP